MYYLQRGDFVFFYSKRSLDFVETLNIDFNSFTIFSFSSWLNSDLNVIFALIKHFEFARMYLTSSSSSLLPPYSIHSKIARWNDKHLGT